MHLKDFLSAKAEELRPADNGFAIDGRAYAENVNQDATSDAWLDSGTSYIWKVGILAQWDGNKCDYAYLFVGHEREPGRQEFVGMLEWKDGENDDIGRSFGRYASLMSQLGHPVFDPN